MSDDLRTGLVEAVARALHGEYADFPEARLSAENALDAALGFLTDNAEAWALAAYLQEGNDIGALNTPEDLIAVLSDGRDTGEKP